MKLTSKFKEVLEKSKDYLSDTAEKTQTNQQVKSLKASSKKWYENIVSNIESSIEKLKQEVNTSVYDLSEEKDVEKVVEKTLVSESESQNVANDVSQNGVVEDVADNVIANAVENNLIHISERQKKIVKYISRAQSQRAEVNAEAIIDGRCKAQKITAAYLSKKFGVHARTIQRDLSVLQEHSIIAHRGPDKGGFWVIAQ